LKFSCIFLKGSDEEDKSEDLNEPTNGDDYEDDDEEDRWEKEQIRKGVQITQVGKHLIINRKFCF
jgi:hypothetical protein